MNYSDDPYTNQLFEAITTGSYKTVELLLEGLDGRDLDKIENAYQHTALVQAATFGDVRIMEILIQAGADPDHADTSGERPLLCAIWQEEEKATQYLLDIGVDPELYPLEDKPVLENTSQACQEVIAEFLRKNRSEKMVKALTEVSQRLYNPQTGQRPIKRKF